MKKLKMGTPSMGLAIGLGLVGAAVLIMLIGFWKALLLMVLFGIGYFIGTVENKQEFIRDAANRIIPAKEAKVIDIKSEITREPEEQTMTAAASVVAEILSKPQDETVMDEAEAAAEEEQNEDGE